MSEPVQRPFDPSRQTCFGHYGYGAGYYAPEGEAERRRTGATEVPTYCNRCPQGVACWVRHREATERADPEGVARFEEVAAVLGGGRAAAYLAAQGTPDPYFQRLLGNIQAGLEDRYELDPPVKGTA